MVDGKTKVCGLIGNPVEHSISPQIHNTLAKMLGINMIYVPFRVEESLVEEALKGAWALSINGLNVTVPHKSAVIPFLKDVDPLAAKIGAVNTLVRMEDGFKGYNTDMTGLLRAMKSDGINLEGEEVIIIGAGGVARAVAYLCAENGGKRVYMLNRSLEKAQAVAGEVNGNAGREIVVPLALTEYDKIPEKRYLTIQATSVGLYPDTEKAPVEDAAFYSRVKTGYDLIYTPAKTGFMRLCNEAGASAYNGLKMLIYQGVEAFEKWNQTEITEEMALEIYGIQKKNMEK